MQTENIKEAIKEAERFIKFAKSCVEARAITYGSGDYIFHNSAPKESGAVRRASMDLTRKLADMRRP